MDETKIRKRLRQFGHERVLEMLDRLADEKKAETLEEIAGLDLQHVQNLASLIGTPPTDISFSDVKPPKVERVPLSQKQQRAERGAVRLGAKALKGDRVVALTVAGGHGTRLGYDHPKGTYPISPIRNLCLFGLFAEQILAARRTYGCRLPWFIMNSPSTAEETRHHFEEHNYYGLGADNVHFFCQDTNPILDEDGGLLLTPEGRLLRGPDGHGGTFNALQKSGLTELMRENGWDLISYFQVDNPLATVADPRFIGHHVKKGAEFSCKVVPKRSPDEGLGLAVLKDSHPAIVEYVDVPDEVASARSPSGKLRFTFGSIAIHILSLPFVERIIDMVDGLPWHVAEKQYDVLDPETGRAAPAECHKFERFVFDALPMASECAFVEVRRDTEFAPVKTAEGDDSPATAKTMMQRMWLQWVRSTGVRVDSPRDLAQPVIEISPLFAADAEELRSRVESDWRPELPLLLVP